MLILKVGFRNLLRNKRRTILASLAIGMGLAAIIVADGFWKGMIVNMVDSVTKTYLGHGQVHHPKFLETFESHYFIKHSDQIIQSIKSNPDIAHYSERSLSIGMISSAEDSLNVNVMGIIPEKEQNLSLFKKRLIKGKFLESDTDILIGERLRKKLGVDLGERIVITVTNSQSGDIEQQLFRLSGVFGIGSKEMDEGFILIKDQKLRSMIGTSGPQEIVFNFKDLSLVDQNKDFFKTLNSEFIDTKSWKELVPQIVAAIEMSDISIGVMASILSALVALGILNTMFMSLYERTYEFGVVRAIGTKNSLLVKIIMIEAFALAIFSVIVGFVIALIAGGLMYKFGLDYSGISFGEMTFTERIYFVFDWNQYTIFPLSLITFTVLISLYPAIHAIRIRPAEALHKSL